MFRENMRKGGRIVGGVVAGVMAGAAFDAHAQPSPDLHEQHIEGEADRIGDLSFDYFVPLLRPVGEVSWAHLGRLLEPAYVDLGRNRTKPETVSFVVPYEYARLFDTGNPLAPDDYEAARSWMAAEVKRDLADNLMGLPWDTSHYSERTGFVPGNELVVDQINILGMTSPEAHGAASVDPAQVDDANLELGRHRGEDALTRLFEVLNAEGVNVSEAVSTVAGDELQFSTDEFARLTLLADAQGHKGSDEEKVYGLISRYNANRITDHALKAELDTVVGSKRQVQIEITFKDRGRDHLLLPVPLALLPLLLLRRRRESAPTPATPAVKRPEIWKTTPDAMKDPRDYALDVEVDLTKNFNYYQPLVDPRIANNDWDLNEMTHDTLEAWNTTDNARRRMMGQPEQDHKQNPRQVFYAYMHAVALRELTKEAQAKAPNTPLSEAWKDSAIRSRVAAAMIKEAEYLAKINNKKLPQ